MLDLAKTSHRSPGARLAAAILAVLSLLLVLGAQANAQPRLKILAPQQVPATQSFRFSAKAPPATRGVSFFVDGRRSGANRSQGPKLWRSGSIKLAPGKHRLTVKARDEGGTIESSRSVRVTPTMAPPEEASRGSQDGGPGPREDHGSYEQPTTPQLPTKTQPPATQPIAPPSSPPTTQPIAPPPSSPPGRGSSPRADLLFNGSRLSDFGLEAAPQAITEVPDPAGSGETVLKMTVSDSDVYPVTPTDNPRAQALSPAIVHPGDELWLQTKFFIPHDFPNVPGWMSLVSIYGPPFDGSSPWQIGINDREFRWQRNETYDDDIPWRAPLVEDRWVSVLLHERFAADGFVEMWVDGQPITFFPKGNRNPGHAPQTQHLEMATMDSSNDGGANSAKIMQYRMAGMFQSASVYFGALKVGKTRAAVEG